MQQGRSWWTWGRRGWGEGAGPFLYRQYKGGLKILFLHHVNNTEDNLKQNIYTGMEVISRGYRI